MNEMETAAIIREAEEAAWAMRHEGPMAEVAAFNGVCMPHGFFWMPHDILDLMVVRRLREGK